jgi:hypothetical protein
MRKLLHIKRIGSNRKNQRSTFGISCPFLSKPIDLVTKRHVPQQVLDACWHSLINDHYIFHQ